MSAPQSSLKESKIVELFSTLEKNECKIFRKFVHSPLFCTNQKVVKLCDLLVAAYPTFSQSRLQKQKVYKQIFKAEPKDGNYQPLVLLCTYLRKLFYQFLQYKLGKEQELWQKWLMLRAWNGRMSQNNIEEKIKIYKKELKAQAPFGSRDLIGRYLLADFLLTQNQGRFEVKGKLINKSLKRLDDLYFTDKLKRHCLNMQLWFAGKATAAHDEMFSGFHLDDLLKYYENCPKKSLLSQIYFYLVKAFLALRSEDLPSVQKYYKRLRKKQRRLIKKIPRKNIMESSLKDDFIDIYHFCTALCNHTSRRLGGDYQVKLFKLYREQEKYELLSVDGLLPHAHYKNLVTLALRTGKLKKASKIIKRYKGKENDPVEKNNAGKKRDKNNDVGRVKGISPVEFQDAAHTYNLAHLRLYEGKYSEVHKLTTQKKINKIVDPYYKIGAATIRLKAYYLTAHIHKDDQYELFDDFKTQRTSLLSYLKRNQQLAEQQKKAYINFMRFINDLMNIKKGRNIDISSLRSKIAHAQPVFEKVWLLNQLKEFEGRI